MIVAFDVIRHSLIVVMMVNYNIHLRCIIVVVVVLFQLFNLFVKYSNRDCCLGDKSS